MAGGAVVVSVVDWVGGVWVAGVWVVGVWVAVVWVGGDWRCIDWFWSIVKACSPCCAMSTMHPIIECVDRMDV